MGYLEYKNPIKIRDMHLSCPLPFTIESYWQCEADCFHCMGRRLNKIWGMEQRVTNPENIRKILTKKSNNFTIKKKKALFIGRKADAYQDIEKKLKITHQIINILNELQWYHVICSKYQKNMVDDTNIFKKYTTILIELTVGLENDWELFERKRTTNPIERLSIGKDWKKTGIAVAIRGEPFIAGYHTIAQFKETLRLIKFYGYTSFNIYALHMNEYTMKRFYEIGLDIERIWHYQQEENWKIIQTKLCHIAQKEGIELGCPDFVNTPKTFKSNVNTCCGVNIPNAFTYNTHIWRQKLQSGVTPDEILKTTNEGCSISDIEKAKIILSNKDNKDYFTFKNTGLL